MKILGAILFLLTLSFAVAAEECPSTPPKIDKAIRRHVSKLRAAEYCEARTVKAEGGITVAIYTAEGACAGFNARSKPGTCSNNWSRYMVVLAGQCVTPPIEVGSKGDLSDTGVEISEGIIKITGLVVGPNDAMCCPSVPEARRFKFSQARLSRIRP
ncbi:hypothetical protein [Candidatus Methylobacter oryzae]|uniref:Uncharacterized protein n=1 Tax=Candidatus Methylobacter oryzae TaxID=2497749 RepID=A0ABY3C4V2_9GAMM|nr:hypothetical protein [Candidatus Methylobacter oryzae]TRW89492.1 hypothetical protein EKO24_020720 [Candidatus Methylobacter oryzae]